MADHPAPGRQDYRPLPCTLHPGQLQPVNDRQARQNLAAENMPGRLLQHRPRLIMLTKSGLERVETELRYLKTVCRRQIADHLKMGLQLGNWDEAPEYAEALREQALLEQRIAFLERKMRMTALLRDFQAAQHVTVGAKVRMRDVNQGEELECVLIGSLQAKPLELLISDESPLGDALLGHQVGDRVQVWAPEGIFEYEILEVGPSSLLLDC